MFKTSVLIGSYAYAILLLGLINQLRFNQILGITLLWVLLAAWNLYALREHLYTAIMGLQTDLKNLCSREPLWIGMCLLLIISLAVLLLGALGPEINHDALWYHLTLPKLYLQESGIKYFQGDYLYYSLMPQLIEMLYIPALAFHNEISAKLIHFGFGILCLATTYVIARPKFGVKTALMAVLIVATDLGFGWSSATANIDLGRAFFELAGLGLFLAWSDKKTPKLLFQSGLLFGFALATKYFSLFSAFSIICLIAVSAEKEKLRSILVFVVGVVATSWIWFVRAFYYSGNPLYPIFTSFLDHSYAPNPASIVEWLYTPFYLSLDSRLWDSALSPLYLLLVPLAILITRKNKKLGIFLAYALVSFSFWLILPRTGGTRFLLPYIPIWAIISASIFSTGFRSSRLHWVQKISFALVVLVAIFNLSVELKLREKVVPVILGQQSKNDYLLENLNLESNILDIDGMLEILTQDARAVYVVGKGNLYYAPFAVLHESYAEKNLASHVLVFNSTVPEFVQDANLLYANDVSHVQLYTLNE